MHSEAAQYELKPAQRSKIQDMLNQPGIKEKVVSRLESQGIPSHTPCLKLELLDSSGKRYALDQKDVMKVFQSFGEVKSLRVIENTALILFKDITSAYFAHKILNGRELPGFEARLTIDWYTSQEVRLPLREITEPKENNKYTCRFNIQIENDKDFQVARRLIGAKGSNMKKIIEVCCGGMPGQAHDIVKIRLRGRGSGFKEGPRKSESEEPLHMCVSSKFKDKYEIAVGEVEKLIAQVYEEYKEYCRIKRLPFPDLAVRKVENVSGKNLLSCDRLVELEGSGKLYGKEVEELIDIRNEARRQCNFAEADRIRELLRKKGIILIDEKGARGKGTEVTTWKSGKE